MKEQTSVMQLMKEKGEHICIIIDCCDYNFFSIIIQIKKAFKKHNLKKDSVVSALIILFQHSQLDDSLSYAASLLNECLTTSDTIITSRVFQNPDFRRYLQSEYEQRHIDEFQKGLRSDLSRTFMDINANLLLEDVDLRGNIRFYVLVLMMMYYYSIL
jgi:hypothetical protein